MKEYWNERQNEPDFQTKDNGVLFSHEQSSMPNYMNLHEGSVGTVETQSVMDVPKTKLMVFRVGPKRRKSIISGLDPAHRLTIEKVRDEEQFRVAKYLKRQDKIREEDPIVKYTHYQTYRQLKSGQGQRGTWTSQNSSLKMRPQALRLSRGTSPAQRPDLRVLSKGLSGKRTEALRNI
jgi:hypothetical protein